MAKLERALNTTAFIGQLMPDLIRTGRALYRLFDGDIARARTVLQIVRDHGARLDEARAEFDRKLAEARAERAKRADA
jgi:hypothetical protein